MRSQDFLAFYVKGDRVLAVAGMNRDREMAAIEELMRLDRMPSPARLRNGPVDFSGWLGGELVFEHGVAVNPQYDTGAEAREKGRAV